MHSVICQQFSIPNHLFPSPLKMLIHSTYCHHFFIYYSLSPLTRMQNFHSLLYTVPDTQQENNKYHTCPRNDGKGSSEDSSRCSINFGLGLFTQTYHFQNDQCPVSPFLWYQCSRSTLRYRQINMTDFGKMKGRKELFI